MIRRFSAGILLVAALSTGCAVAEGPASSPSSVAPASAAEVTPINDRAYYPAVLKLIQEAEHSVRICLYQVTFYDEYPGSASNNLIDALCEASRRGVEVTAVLDRSAWRGDHDEKNGKAARMLAEAGVSVYLDPDPIQSHQKLAIIDRDVVVVASTNWSHYALEKNKEVGVVLWSKAAGRHFEQYFAQRVADGEPLPVEEVKFADLASTVADERVELGFPAYEAADVQYLENQWYYYRLAQAVRKAEKSIDVVQSYAYYYAGANDRARDIPGRPAGKPPEPDLMADELIAAAKRGVRVRAVFDATKDGDFEKEWSAKALAMAKHLVAGGVEVYEDDLTEQIHAKMLVIDGKQVVVGSTNWSFEAMEMNNEANVLVESPALVREVYAPWVEDIVARGRRWLPEEHTGTPAGEGKAEGND